MGDDFGFTLLHCTLFITAAYVVYIVFLAVRMERLAPVSTASYNGREVSVSHSRRQASAQADSRVLATNGPRDGDKTPNFFGRHSGISITIHTHSRICCQCGHEGMLLAIENPPDTPLYEKYSFIGFGGDALTVTSYRQIPKGPLAAMKPMCPTCKEIGNVEYI